MSHPLVVNCGKRSYDVYVGRPGPFGNPFKVGKHGTREEVIARFEEYLWKKPKLLDRVLMELPGKVLGCWCSPLSCHGDVLARIANPNYPE